jgi:HNH endonuclease
VKNGPYILVKAPKAYPGKRYRGKYCYEHILVFWRRKRRLPKPGYIVHHRNEDKTDNSPDNLEEIRSGDHSSLHTKPIAWVKLFCTQCKGLFFREPRQIKKLAKPFCSRECLYNFQRESRW